MTQRLQFVQSAVACTLIELAFADRRILQGAVDCILIASRFLNEIQSGVLTCKAFCGLVPSYLKDFSSMNSTFGIGPANLIYLGEAASYAVL